jgi:hypothetical protein
MDTFIMDTLLKRQKKRLLWIRLLWILHASDKYWCSFKTSGDCKQTRDIDA